MTYDGVGNRTALAATVNSDATYSGSTSYAYDAKDELINETSTRNGGYTNAFAFDGAENPTTFRGTSGKTYNSDSQQTGAGFAYDGNGNPTTYKGTSLTFDVENRLTSVGTTLTAVYGVDSRRALSTASATTTCYLYDGDSSSPVCEMNSSGAIIATNTYGLTGLISRHTSSGSSFYEFDPQGTVVQRLNSAGSNTITSTADAFGNVASSGTVSDPFGYEAQAGYYTDQSTGLILTTFRYFDPVNGRFLNRDPIGSTGGLNLYNYTANNAVSATDPSGLAQTDTPIGGPQTFWDCVLLALKRYWREGGNSPISRVRDKAGNQLADDLAQCIELEVLKREAERLKNEHDMNRFCNNVNDILHNRVPGTGGNESIFGNSPVNWGPPWGGVPPIWRWVPDW
jgi:RHS repeat-associated protein